MLPVRDIDRMRNTQASDETRKTLVDLFRDPPPELLAFFDRFLAERANEDMLASADPLPFERKPAATSRRQRGTDGPPEAKRKMQRIQKLKDTLG